MKKQILIATNGFPATALFAIVALTGCEPSELNSVGGIPFGGGSNSGSYTAPAPAQNLAPMLQDPDARMEEWEDDVFANSQAEAEARCLQMAENRSRSSGGAIQSRGAYQVKGKLYRCKFSSEVPNENDR